MRTRAKSALLFAAVFVPQLLLVAAAQQRADRAFGFSMFPESSWVHYALSWRAPDGREEALADGCLPSGPCMASVTRRPDLTRFDQAFVAPYGSRAVLARMSLAMHALLHQGPAREGTLLLRYRHARNLHPEQQGLLEAQVRP